MSRPEPMASAQAAHYLWEHPKHAPRIAPPQEADFAAGDPLWVRCYPVELYARPAASAGAAAHARGDAGSRAAFLAGVQHAAKMFIEAEGAKRTSRCAESIEPEFRENLEQNNIAEGYLRQLLERPELLPGFAAALTDYIAMDSSVDGAYYAALREDQLFTAGA